MDGKITTPAALNGDVRTIPLIDKTLSIEGQCADAKKTGDAFAEQGALINDNSDAIAVNAAAIQALREENGVQDTTLGEHKLLIEGNEQKIVACENSLGEAHRKIGEAENAIAGLQEVATAASETIAEINERLVRDEGGITATYDIVTEEIKPELATAQNDIEVLKTGVANIEQTMAADKEALSNGLAANIFAVTTTSDKLNDAYTSYYVKNAYLCQVALHFAVSEDIDSGEIVFGGLPKPAVDATAAVFNTVSGDVYSLGLEADGYAGVIRNKLIVIPAGARVTGSFSYIVAADSGV